MIKNLLVLFFLSTLLSCSDEKIAPELLKAENFYKRDMIMTVNGLTVEGSTVASKSQKYDISIESKGNLDLFVMTSCHKEETKERAWNVKKTVRSGLFGWGKKKIDLKNQVNFTYYPNKLEAEGDCPLEFGGYDKNGKHSWGFLDFESNKYTLKADIECNGIERKNRTTSHCQARSGLIQRISFKENVILAENNDCGIIQKDQKIIEFEMPSGKCVLVFSNVGALSFHKMTLLGYDKIIIRE